jgi:Carboxypeptidase regulatory-like domain
LATKFSQLRDFRNSLRQLEWATRFYRNNIGGSLDDVIVVSPTLVVDSSGAKIANADVSATDVTTHFTTKTKTNGSGEYSIPFLTPDTYEVAIEISGFRPETRTGVVLTAGGVVRTDFALKVGAVGEQVVVTAGVEMLDTASANLGTTMGTKQVTDLPIVGRNPFVLSTLAPGVTTGAYMQSKASGFTNPFSGTAVQIIAEGSIGHNRLTLDGIPDDPAESS